MGQQEVSRPVMISLIAAAVIVIGIVGWFFFMRPQKYPGYQAPVNAGSGAPSGMVPGMSPSMMPGAGNPQAGTPR